MVKLSEAQRSPVRKRGRVPTYWWDFDPRDQIIIETDDPRVPDGVVERFAYTGIASIERAEGLVRQLKEGRRS